MRKNQHALFRKGSIASYVVTMNMRINQKTDLTGRHLPNSGYQLV